MLNIRIPIERIIIGDISERMRKKIDGKKVEEFAESIKKIGLINPIFVCRDSREGYFRLIAGLHRLEAVKLNGENEIDATITDEKDPLKIELVEIDENLKRNPLHYLERGEHLARRKQIYDQLYGKKAPDGNSETISSFEPKPFTQDAAEKLNVSRRTVEQEVQLATNLIPEMKSIIKETGAGKVEALSAARLEPEVQKKAAEKIVSGEAASIKDAVGAVRPVAQAKTADRICSTLKEFEAFVDSLDLKELPQESRDAAVISLKRILQKLSGPKMEGES